MKPELIVIGGSAGGLSAVDKLVRDLPVDFAIPIVVVLHLKQDQSSTFLDYFYRARLRVREATEKSVPMPGHVYFAPPGYHLLLEADGTFSLSADDRVNFARPSIDVLFESAADAIGNRLVGVILTGGNEDGAAGLAAIKAVGGLCIVQDPAEAETRFMPEAALKATVVDHTLSLGKIATLLFQLGQTDNAGRAHGAPIHA